MDDLGAVVSELGGLLGGDHRQQTSRRDLAGIGSEDTVDLLPNLQLRGRETDSAKGSAEIAVATTDLGQKRAGDDSKEAWGVRIILRVSFCLNLSAGTGGLTGNDGDSVAALI